LVFLGLLNNAKRNSSKPVLPEWENDQLVFCCYQNDFNYFRSLIPFPKTGSKNLYLQQRSTNTKE